MLFRWGIFLLACVFLYTRLSGIKGIEAGGRATDIIALKEHGLLLMVVLVLMVLNWGVEAQKWRMLIRPVELLGIRRAFLATIAGTSVGLVTINRTGEFLGRVLFLRPENRVRGGFATALGSIAQFVVTLVFGGAGLLGLLVLDLPLPWPPGGVSWVVASLSSMATVVALILYFNPGVFRQVLLVLPFLHRLGHASQVLGHYQRSELTAVLLMSALRYLVFGCQFLLLLMAAHAGLSIGTVLVAVPVVYLIATLIPSVMLTELGVRGSVAVAVMGPLGAAVPPVLFATATLWTINVALPAMVGSLILLFARIRTRNGPE